MLKYKIEEKELVLVDSDLPLLKPDEILIKVKSIGLNRADLYQIQGSYLILGEDNNTPGLEVAGIIDSIGSNVSELKIGDRVMALLKSGGYAEYVSVSQELVIRIPKEMNFIEAASILEAYATAYYNLVIIGQLSSKNKILITGGASGVGCACIQLSKLYEAEVTALISSKDKALYCSFLGAYKTIVYTENFELDGTYNIIIDMYGGDFINQYLNCVSQGAKIINIALLKNKLINIKMAKLLFGNISLIGSTLRNQSNFVKKNLLQNIEKIVLPALIQGKIKFTIDSIFNFLSLKEALLYLENGQHKGKVVISLN